VEKYLIIESNWKSLNKLEAFLDDFFEELNLDRISFYNILLSLTESVGNSISHGNNYDEEKSVIITASWEDNKLGLMVEDEGIGFDVNKLKDPTLPENIHNESGRGLYLIRKLADEVNLLENGRVIEIKFKTNREHQVL